MKESLPELLQLAAEVLRTPGFSKEEFERLQQEQIAGFEAQRSDPQTLGILNLQRHLTPRGAQDPRYVPLPDESIASLKAVTLEDVKAFWQKFAGASDGELVVVGAFDPTAIGKLAGELLSGWKSPQPYRRIVREYAKVAPASSQIETPDKANAFYVTGMLLPVTDEDADYPALVLAGYMLGGHSASRLYLRIRGKEGLSYGANASISAGAGDRAGLFMAGAIAAPQNVLKVDAAFRDEMTKAVVEGFNAAEVAKAKNGWLESRRVARANDGNVLNLLQSQLQNNRTTAFSAELEKKVAMLTPEQVTAALKKHVALERLSFFRAGDFKKGTGTE